MHWDEIKKKFPQTWLIIEAINAHSISHKRVLDEINVVDSFADSQSAMKEYKKLHREKPARELYVFHTSRDSIDINEKKWIGIRGNE